MREARIAELKARLRHYLRAVRRGGSVTVLDRDTPVARIVPLGSEAKLEVRRATRRPGDLRLPPRPRAHTDSVAILLEDRGAR
jgi:prevent-host-death family protein